MKKIFLALVMLLSLGSTLWIEKASAESKFILIRSTDDWNKFRDMVQEAKNEYDVNALLDADITITQTIGWEKSYRYRGVFDGNGHTVNVSIGGDNFEGIAPFRYVGNCTIMNLHVTGSVKGGIYSAGLIGCTGGGSPTITINCVWVSVDVDASSATHAAGVFGHAGGADVYVYDTRFDGTVKTNNASGGSYVGCIIGWGGEGGWVFHRVYANPPANPIAWRIYFCVDSRYSWYIRPWGSNGNSNLTITSTEWNDWGVTYYNKNNQQEVVNLMNGEMPGSWALVNNKAVPLMAKTVIANDGDWTYLSEGNGRGTTLTAGRYYVDRSLRFSSVYSESGLTINPDATVYIYLPKDVTLTAQGGDALYYQGAGAGIELPENSTLILLGEGRVIAAGGNAANGGNGDNGGAGGWSESSGVSAGSGGRGGDGGGGAGAGIGTRGGDGGAGGSGGIVNYANDWENHDGIKGEGGGKGNTAGAMGKLFYETTYGLQVSATGGKAATNGGRAGSTGKNALRAGGNNYSMGGGGGGGGGGFGGSAKNFGSGGAGGGGGGGGSSGTTRWSAYGYFRSGSRGGGGGKNAEGNGRGGSASNNEMSGTKTADNKNTTLSDRNWEKGNDTRKDGGGGGDRGSESVSKAADHDYIVRCNVMNHFGESIDESKSLKASYRANVADARFEFKLPSYYELGLIQQDKYLSQWNTQKDGRGSWKNVDDLITVPKGITELYAEWRDYKSIFPEGSGTRGEPFIINDTRLQDFADYVNSGLNTRNVWFRQQGDIRLKDVLNRRNWGSFWTPIGHTYTFEGDYDGGGKLIYDGEISEKYNVAGIFGKVAGSIHNLGVKDIKLIYTGSRLFSGSNRYGAIAGELCADKKDEIWGQMRDCFADNNRVEGGGWGTAGALVGEVSKGASITHCHSYKNTISGDYIGHISGRIYDGAKVDFCFTTGDEISYHAKNATNCQTKVSESRMASGELTWLLNDKTAFGTWYQDVDKQGYHDAYPKLDSISSRLYSDGTKYTNEPTGTIFELKGEGTCDKPFLINTISDLKFLADFCNKGNNSTGMHFLQTTDIDMGNRRWTPIGENNGFGGHYDGGGHTIRNAVIETNTIAGIFGIVKGSVKRLCVETSTIRYMKRDGRAGAIAARLTGDGEVSNCLVKKCTVMHNGSTGNSLAERDSRIGVAGGIAADIFDYAVIRNCLVYRTTVAATRTGQICSDTKSNNRIERCYTDGKALVSSDSRAKVIDCLPGLDDATLASGETTFDLNNCDNDNPDPAWYQNINVGSSIDSTSVLARDHAMVFRNDRGNFTNDGVDLRRLGTGTQEDPYKIATPKDLKDLVLGIATMKRSNFYVRQTADIDMKDSLMYPIGSCTDGFEGHYDGGGYVIRNVEMLSHENEPLGLFNNIIGTVERLGIENSTFKATGAIKRVGALAGRLSRKGVVRYCYASGCTVDFNNIPDSFVGALVGEQADTSYIESCYGYHNTVIGQSDGPKHYGYVVGNIGSNAKASLLFTDGPSLCADKQNGAENIVESEKGVSESRFHTGEVAWLLNGSKDNGEIWRQTMRKDSLPVPNSDHKPVFRYPGNIQVLYTNTNELPEKVRLTLYPNYDDKQPRMVEMFKADDRYLIASLPLKPYAEERTGYYLTGWSTQENGKGTFYPYDGEIQPMDQSLTLYAVWDIKVPASGKTLIVTLEDLRDDSHYKVYDNGGYQIPYTANNNGKVTLVAPDDHILCLTGTVATEAAGSDGKPRDYMVVYDGDETSDEKLANDKGENVFFSKTNGDKQDIGTIIGSKDEMTIEFVSDAENCYEGLDILVTVITKEIKDLEGTGTQDAPFLVKTADNLKAVDDYIRLTGDSKIYIKQCADIDLNGRAFTPLASSVSSFEGHYDGGGYVIRNANIETKSFGGIFDVVTGTVERLGVENSTFKNNNDAGHTRVGTIAGRVKGSGKITNCYVKNCTVEENKDGVAGGIVADIYDEGIVSNCFVYQTKVSSGSSGYLCGEMMSGTQLFSCYTDGDKLLGAYAKGKVTDSSPNMTAERFASGEVCYLLNDKKTENVVWRQTLGTDSLPLFTDSPGVVYEYKLNDRNAYSNTAFANRQYYISNKEEFGRYIGKQGDIHLTQDIDVGYLTTNGYHVHGNIDGGGHTVTYRGGSSCHGLFVEIYQGASVKHLRANADVSTMESYGGIACVNEGTISDCHFNGNIKSKAITNNIHIAGIVVLVKNSGVVDHCSATGSLTLSNPKKEHAYPITKDTDRATYCTWVNPSDQKLYAAQKDSALSVQADYPVYAKGILDAVGPEVVVGNNTIYASNKHLSSLTIIDGERFKCSGEVTVDQITYKRRGTNGAYEPWVLPFDHTIDASMLNGNVEFYRFVEDSLHNILTKRIDGSETYQASANEPLAIRIPNESDNNFQMKFVKDGKSQPMTIKMPAGGEGASMASTKDIARLMVTYDSIAADRTVKERMYIWNNDKDDFTLSNGEKGVIPFRYYLQYVDKATGNFLKYEQTDWARRQNNGGGSQQAVERRASLRASFSTLMAQGWQPIFLDPTGSQVVTAQMLDDYEILYLSDIYDEESLLFGGQYEVAVIYEPAEEGMELPYALPLLVKAKRADVEPLVTEQRAIELNTMLERAIEGEVVKDGCLEEDFLEELHYWCATFAGRYDVWQMLLPENDILLNEYGALAFTDTGTERYFDRVAGYDRFTMQPMSYCFTAYDAKTFKNLPLANDRIEILVYGYSEQSDPTGIEDVRGKMDDVRGNMDDAFNLQGQKVDTGYRGIIIKNGHKVVIK